MSFKVIVLALCLAASHAANLHCDFEFTEDREDYLCKASITTTKSDYMIDAVDGQHVEGRSNGDVTLFEIDSVSMEVLPRNLYSWFSGVRTLTVNNVANYPNFRRSDFYDFTPVRFFAFANLPQVTTIPKDTFWDMEGMRKLMFQEMPNMEDFDADFLSRSYALKYFGVINAPKITTIPTGFFRSQHALQTVGFTGTGLTTISYTAFLPTDSLLYALFKGSGCLDEDYYGMALAKLNGDIRKNCKDSLDARRSFGKLNSITKQKNQDYSSSSSSESKN